MNGLRVAAAAVAAAVMLAGCAGQPELVYDRAVSAVTAQPMPIVN